MSCFVSAIAPRSLSLRLGPLRSYDWKVPSEEPFFRFSVGAFNRKVRNPTQGLRICKTTRKRGEEVWLALAAIRLFEAKGFSGLALAVSVRALVGHRLVSRAALQFKGRRPMSTIAAAAQTADRIDYWIRRHVIQYCYGTHPSQSQSKFNSAPDRRVGLSAIGQCLKDQYDALATPLPRHLAALVEQLETQR